MAKTAKPTVNALNRFKRATLKVESYMQPIPLKGRRGPRAGDGTASIVGSVAVADGDIPGPTELAYAALPQTVKDAIPNPDSGTCYKFGKGLVLNYQMVFEESTEELYAVPILATGVDNVYNTAGQVTSGNLIQMKMITIGAKVFGLVDVENC